MAHENYLVRIEPFQEIIDQLIRIGDGRLKVHSLIHRVDALVPEVCPAAASLIPADNCVIIYKWFGEHACDRRIGTARAAMDI